LELIVVLTVGAIIASFAAPRISETFAARAVIDGRDAVIWFSARARATALQTGTVTRLEINPSSDMLEIRLQDNSSTLVDSRDLATLNSVDITTSTGSSIIVCYSPRGWALISSCSTGVPGTVTVTRNSSSTQLQVRTLGQIQRAS
jgi:Tfp pilus assembly protein FimT